MAGVHLTEDEQSERLMQWWKENGTSVIAGLVLGVVVIVGVNYWRSYKTDQAESASTLYARVVERGVGSSVDDIVQQLIDDYASTPYAGKAALVTARIAFDNGDADEARRYLEWAMNNASDPEDRTVARLRLARILLDMNDLDQVEELTAGMQAGGYESEYHELLGDLATARGDPETARTEYEAALDSLPEQSAFADMLNLKLDDAIGASR